MKYLLDTHAFLWFLADDPKLPKSLKKLIENPSNEVFVSVVSLWEISTKYSIRKLELGQSLESVLNLVEENGFERLDITNQHLVLSSKLPFHHRDPFDRLLVAQAKAEKMNIITKDENINLYKVKTTWNAKSSAKK